MPEMQIGAPGMPNTDPGNIYMTPSPSRRIPVNVTVSRHPGTPRALATLLASMLLNKRLRQGGMNQTPTIGMPGTGPRNSMSDLAQMSLNMGRRSSGY